MFIQDHSAIKCRKELLYSIAEDSAGNLVLKTSDKILGELLVEIVDEVSMPKVFLRSAKSQDVRFDLHAFTGFSSEQMAFIEAVIGDLKKGFVAKKDEIEYRIFHLRKTLKPDRHILIREYELLLHQMNHKIEMIEIVIRSTIHIATDFHAYFNNLRNEVKQLESEMRAL